jgi:hypothetical protein
MSLAPRAIVTGVPGRRRDRTMTLREEIGVN